MIETQQIPAIAKSAGQMAFERKAVFDAGFKATIDQLAVETVEAMGLNPADKWMVDFNAGTASRDVPDAVPPVEPPAA